MIHQQGVPPPESEVLSLAPGSEVQITLSQSEVGLRHRHLLFCDAPRVLTAKQENQVGILNTQDTNADISGDFPG